MGLFGDGSRRAARRAARLDRIKARQAGRSNRVEDRQDARQTAYKAGIDPSAFISDSITKVADVAGRFANPMAAAGGVKMGGAVQPKSGTAPGGGGSGLLSLSVAGIPLVAIVAGVLLLKKRKR